MIAVLTDIIQSLTILCWAVIMFFLILRVNRLNKRLDQNSNAVAAVREKREIQDPQPVCGCGHHQCFHDETSCAAATQWNYYDGPNSLQREMVPCGCKRYTGPEPLPTVIP